MASLLFKEKAFQTLIKGRIQVLTVQLQLSLASIYASFILPQ